MGPVKSQGMGIKGRAQERLNRVLVERMLENQKNACYVLITCQKPADDGKMEVELTYDGATDLAAYLVDKAQDILEDKLYSS